MSTALAQHTSEVAEVVIVTGSYIRGAPEDAGLPVDVISSEELEKIGSPTTLELIKGLTVSNGILGDTNQFDSRAQGNKGSGSINLRGLGCERTLVLNGRRLVNNPFTGSVETNLIPTAAIRRQGTTAPLRSSWAGVSCCQARRFDHTPWGQPAVR